MLSAVARTDFDLASGIKLHRFVSADTALYKVRMFKADASGTWRTHWIDVEWNGTARPTDLQSTTPGEFWMTLYQRAYLSPFNWVGENYASWENAFRSLTGRGISSFATAGDAITPALSIKMWLGFGVPLVAGTPFEGSFVLGSHGLIRNHAYTIIGIEAAQGDSSGANTYVTLRNPWGHDTSWQVFDTDGNGALSSAEQVSKRNGLDGNDDGLIRIPWQNFSQFFSRVYFSANLTGAPSNKPLPAPPVFNTPEPGTLTIRAGQSLGPIDFSAKSSYGVGLFYSVLPQSNGRTLGYVNVQSGQFTWEPTSQHSGTYYITVVAQNHNSLATAARTIVVDVLSSTPTISSLSSSHGLTTTAGTDLITLTANGVSSPTGRIDIVRFYRDSNRNGVLDSVDALMGSDTSASGGWTWTGYIPGGVIGTNRFFAQAGWTSFSDNFASTAVSTTISFAAPPYIAPAAIPITNELLATPAASYHQRPFDTTRDSAGNVYFFWNVPAGYSGAGAWMRKFSPTGTALTGAIQLKSGVEFYDIEMLPDGYFAAAYGSLSIQWFNPNGVPTTANPYTLAVPVSDNSVRMSANAQGHLLVTYHNGGYFDENIDAFSIDHQGNITRQPWVVNSHRNGMQKYPTTALNADGRGIIAWTDFDQSKIMYRLVDTYGQYAGDERVASSITNGSIQADNPMASTVLPNGDFILAWSTGSDIYVRRFTSAGDPIGSEFRANTDRGANKAIPKLASNALGWFAVGWTSYGQDESGVYNGGAYAQVFGPNGVAAGPEFRVNQTTAYYQYIIGMVMDADSDLTFGMWNGGFGSPNLDNGLIRFYRTNIAPTFTAQPGFNLSESATLGQIVGYLSPYVFDADGDSVTFQAMNTSPFAVSSAGMVTLVNPVALDRETTQYYFVPVKVTDGSGASETVSVYINILDVDEAPAMQPREYEIGEWDGNGTHVGFMEAFDPERKAITYIIEDDGPFDIDPITGAIRLTDRTRIDFEQNATWNVQVKAIDGPSGAGTTATATIRIRNVDDYAAVRGEFGFKSGGSFYANSYGYQEKWFLDRTGAWHVILPNGDIRKADKGPNLPQGTLIGNVGSAAHANPSLFLSAATSLSASSQAGLSQLRATHGFRFQSSLFENANGFKEKWFVDRAGSWHVLFPDGTIRKVDADRLDRGTMVSQVDPLVYDDPSLLFNAPISLSTQATDALSQLRHDNGFYLSGSYYENSSGFREKWIKDRTGAWFVLLPNGELRKVDAGSRLNQGTLKATVSVLVYDDPNLLLKAPANLSQAESDGLSQLRRDNGFKLAGSLYFNSSGYQEKWIQDRTGAWFVLLPNGQLRKVDAGSRLDLGTLKATVNKLVYDDPDLLLTAAMSLSTEAQNQLSQLRRDHGLFVNVNDWFNAYGYREKWLQDRSGKWFVLLPNGELRQANAGANLRDGSLLTTIDVAAYDDVKLLTAAAVTLPTATQTTIAQLKTDYGFQLKGSLYFNWYGYREKWFADRTGAWYVILPNGQIRKVDAGGNLTAGSLKGSVDPLVWDDPNALFA
ncbi:MAG: C2 family cysteine protease [Gemmataceae bacterium]